MTAYEVREFSEIDFPPSVFKRSGGDISINGELMGKYMGAVVTSKGEVLMGHFIRTFD